jgi:hypothetical protein
MDEKFEGFAKIQVGEVFRKLADLQDFEAVMQGIPVYSPEEIKKRFEEGNDDPFVLAAQLLWGTVALVLGRVEKDCRKANVDLTQEETDKIAYFSSRLIESFVANSQPFLMSAELIKKLHGIDLSDAKDPQQMAAIINEALEKKGQKGGKNS